MIPHEIIRRKRDGEILSEKDIGTFISALAKDEISESQIAAFAMAVWFRGMTRDETVALTLAMAKSGETLSWAGIDRPVADKHSTGGVGDNVSLMLAPIAAVCGLAVPMISGRGLGHTGGTLDKLESIPGYRINPDAGLFRRAVSEVGCAIIGQTTTLAPADRRLYAVRDVTATVDSMPLITASILSKKLAAGLHSLVLDVKAGNGAFLTDRQETEELARSLVEVANGAGVRTSALITDMSEPLADAAGNAVEVRTCLDFLAGKKKGTRLEAVVLTLATEMLLQSGIVLSASQGERMARDALSSGRAAETFGRMVHFFGGPADLIEKPERSLARAPVERPAPAPRDGWLAQSDTRAIGMSVIALGGGRRHPGDHIDHRVGFSGFLPLGTHVRKGDPIALVHAADASAADEAAAALVAAYEIGDEPPALPPLVIGRI